MSVGGAVLPIILRELTARMGYVGHLSYVDSRTYGTSFRWTTRVLGFVFLGTTTCVNIVSIARRALIPFAHLWVVHETSVTTRKDGRWSIQFESFQVRAFLALLARNLHMFLGNREWCVLFPSPSPQDRESNY